MTDAFVIALLGAESTGKTVLAGALASALATPARRVTVVPEYLREFCDRHGRTPRPDEQAHIAAEQTRRIEAAAQSFEIVVADTTAVMIAVYSEHVFGDTGLYASALADHARCDLTLLTALDLPWQADGLQRDGPHVREPVDAAVRNALVRANLAYSVVSGSGSARLEAALACVQRALAPPPEADSSVRWQWHCERCGDTACERHALLPKA
ncbi:MAG: ATP-binding protein [Burkholderiaceae bacterium]